MGENYLEPIRTKVDEWIWYDDHKPKSNYWDHIAEHERFRSQHDRDCVLTGGNLYADTLFSLWTPFKNTLIRLHGTNKLSEIGNVRSKIQFVRNLNKEGILEVLLPEEEPIVSSLVELFKLGLNRENVFILPDRRLNPQRAWAPYYDYVPAFLYDCFEGGKFSKVFQGDEALKVWIQKEKLYVFFDGSIDKQNILGLSGSNNVMVSEAPEGVDAMKKMLDNYVAILKKRKTEMC